MDEQLQPFEAAGGELVVRAALAPVRVRVGAVAPLREPRRLHDVHGSVDRLRHVLGIGVVPGDDGIEAVVERGGRIDGVEPDGVAELAQLADRVAPRVRAEVVEAALRHEEVRRARAELVLDARDRESRVEREVDVVAQEDVAGPRLAVERRPPVAARLRRLEQLPVVG
jgi:hypothetical protein